MLLEVEFFIVGIGMEIDVVMNFSMVICVKWVGKIIVVDVIMIEIGNDYYEF